MDFSKHLQSLRKEAGLSQEEVAEQLHLSRQAVSKLEGGQSLPDIGTCIKLCEIFKVTPNRLLLGVQETQESVVQEAKAPKRTTFVIAAIFLMTVLVCGTVLLICNLYNGAIFEPIIHTLAIFMVSGSLLAFIVMVLYRLIRKRKATE